MWIVTEILLLLDEFIVGTGKATAAVHDWVGGIVSGVVEGVRFLRKMWAEWDTGVLLVGLVTQQMGENLGDAFLYVGLVAGRVGDWISSNWRAIFEDLVMVAAKVMLNLAKIVTNAWDQVKKAARGDFADIDFNAFNPLEVLKKSHDLTGVKLIAPPLIIDKFKLTNSFGDRITDALARIMGVEVRLPNKDTEHKPLVEEGLDQAGKAKKAKKAAGEGVGKLMGARELLDAMQSSSFKKEKDSKHLQETARNTGEQVGAIAAVGVEVRDLAARLFGGPRAKVDAQGRVVGPAGPRLDTMGRRLGRARARLDPSGRLMGKRGRVDAQGRPMSRKFDAVGMFVGRLAHKAGAEAAARDKENKIMAKVEEHNRKQVVGIERIGNLLGRGVVARLG